MPDAGLGDSWGCWSWMQFFQLVQFGSLFPLILIVFFIKYLNETLIISGKKKESERQSGCQGVIYYHNIGSSNRNRKYNDRLILKWKSIKKIIEMCDLETKHNK